MIISIVSVLASLRTALALAYVGVVAFAWSASVAGAADIAPKPDAFAAGPDAPTLTIATNGSRTFVGGRDPRAFGTGTHGTAVVSAFGGALRQIPADTGVGAIVAAVADRDGGWYVAGPRHVRRLTAGGDLDPAFAVEVTGDIRALALSSDGTSLWLAGSLRSVNGVARHGLAAVAVTDGTTRPFTVPEVSEAWSLGVARDTVYVAGRSATGAGILAVDGSGAIRARGPAGTGTAIAVAPDGETVYASNFAAGGGAILSALDAASLSASRWTLPGDVPDSLAVSRDGRMLYVAPRLGAVRTDTGTPVPWGTGLRTEEAARITQTVRVIVRTTRAPRRILAAKTIRLTGRPQAVAMQLKRQARNVRILVTSSDGARVIVRVDARR